MSFPKYPEYKPSSLDGKSSLPSSWSEAPVKRMFELVGGSTPKTDNEDFWDGELTWVTPADLSGLETVEVAKSKKTITPAGLLSCGTTLVPKGSIVISTRAPIGTLAISGTELCTNQGCKSLIPGDKCLSCFAYYYLSVSTEQLNARGKGTTFVELSGDELGSFPMPVPSTAEQELICKFLDRETAKIDALIAEQQRLIELLQEKRQAVISHAVTKGLNPNAPMKDSGVEWLGEVPEHWEVKSLKHLFRMKSGDFITSDSIEAEGAYPVFGGNGLRGFTNSFNREGSYALIGRQGALCGNVNTANGRFWASEHAVVCVHECETSLDWLCKMLEAANLNQYSTSAAQPGLSVEVIGNTKVPCPPPSEQIDIGAWIAQELSKIDATIETSDQLVTVLGERRSALISAAVTGQIDVRGLATEEEEAA